MVPIVAQILRDKVADSNHVGVKLCPIGNNRQNNGSYCLSIIPSIFKHIVLEGYLYVPTHGMTHKASSYVLPELEVVTSSPD